MQKLLYYPNFEIQDINFLKFALIYIDEIKPIIPMCAMDALSDETKEIIGYTDLIQPLQPRFQTGQLASIATIDFLEKSDNFTRYSYGMRPKAKQHIYLTGNKNYTLYSDKYTYEFENYCLENNLAERCMDGMRIEENVAYSFMSILADLISKENEIDMITDCKRYADYHLYVPNGRSDFKMNKRLDEIKREIEFQIPVDIRHIPVQEFLKLRTDEHFNEIRKSFVEELNKILDEQHVDKSSIDLYDYFACKEELIGLLKNAFISCATIAVGSYSFGSALVNPEMSLAFFANIGNLGINLSALKQSGSESKKYIEKLETKKQARRYLARLNKMGLGTL